MLSFGCARNTQPAGAMAADATNDMGYTMAN